MSLSESWSFTASSRIILPSSCSLLLHSSLSSFIHRRRIDISTILPMKSCARNANASAVNEFGGGRFDLGSNPIQCKNLTWLGDNPNQPFLRIIGLPFLPLFLFCLVEPSFLPLWMLHIPSLSSSSSSSSAA